jgi:trk system potassium uptake protein TrkH
VRDTLLFGGAPLLVLRNVGLLLRYIAPVPLLMLPAAVYYDEWDAITSVLLTFALFLGVGTVLSYVPARREPRLREGLLIAAVGWLVVPLGSVVPFMALEGWTFLDSYFETMSAWTGTGMSLADVEALHQTTLLWRSLMQWVGGLGVIVLTLAILARPGTGAHTLYVSEGREDKLRPSVLSTVRTLWRLYIGLTAAAIVLLLAIGLPIWHAINHALTGIATGGMSITRGSIGEYGQANVEWAMIAIMITGALPFVALYALVRGRWNGFLRDEQVRAFAVVALVFIPLLAWGLAHMPVAPPDALRAAVFQGISAMSTTGFQSADISSWTPAAKIGMAGLMLLGGAAGSTAGGVKLFRGVLLLKGALWKLRRSGLPHFSVTTFRFGGERLDEREANEEFADAAFIVVLWITMLFIGTMTLVSLLPHGIPFENVFFEVASVQANIGLSVGIVSPTMPEGAKVALAGLMWAGRLEILPVLLLLRGLLPRFPKR